MKILCLGAHPDDIELGAGATISKMISEGAEVYGHCFTVDCQEYSFLGLPIEMMKTFNLLGIIRTSEGQSNFNPRNLPRQFILEEMLKLKDLVKPDMVFTHSSSDKHQDHEVIYNESFRAFKNTRVLGYDMPWNYDFNDNRTLFSKVNESQADIKLSALALYRSQQHRSTMQSDYVKSLMRVRGQQINALYAEAFETIRWIL
jgi:LmbE family N-acetylglucosaminyl deacetylase